MFEVVGPLDVPALEASLRALVQRHDAVRARFEAVDGHPVQVIEPALPTPLRVVDLTDLPAADRDSESERRVAAELLAPFDLRRGPSLRLTLLRRAPDDHLLFAIHHIVCDGWSLDLLLGDLGARYAAIRAGRPLTPATGDPAEPPVDYLDLVGWQRDEAAARMPAARTHWEQVCTPPPASFLTGYTSEVPGDTYENARRRFALAPGTADQLVEWSRRLRVTPFIALLGSLQVTLWWLSGQTDLSVGSVFATRPRRSSRPSRSGTRAT